jgi:hypothetical protein
MTDLTKITSPFGLLEDKTQKALHDHLAAGGEVEVFNNGWHDVVGADFCFASPVTYRAKPKPLEFWVNQYNWGFPYLHRTKAEADTLAHPARIRCIRLIEAPDQSEGV